MPAVRLTNRRASAIGRRRSSIATLNPVTVKPGVYGYSTSSAAPPPPPPTSASSVTFAPNVTPISYSAPSPSPSPYGSPSLTTDLPLPLFPPSATPAPPPTRRRAPPGKRRSQGYVPRPPNAFMLFRADFVRQKHVPGSIETNHGSLSKIIGNCWRALPLPEKHIWETKAKHAKAEHKLKYPDYKFRPVHNKRPSPSSGATSPSPAPVVKPPPPPPSSTKQGQLTPAEDERRCEAVAQLLLQGKKGEALADAVRDLDWRRAHELSLSSPHSHQHDGSSSSSPSPVSAGQYQQQHGYDATSSKYPHPLHLDPLYYPSLSSHSAGSNPASASSPPSSTFTRSSSHSHGGSPYGLPLTLPSEWRPQQQQQHQQQQSSQSQAEWRLHRRSSSVPLPNDYTNAYTFPPFMPYPTSYPPTSNSKNASAYSFDPALTLPFPAPSASSFQGQGGSFTLPPPPSSGDDSLAGMLPSISSLQPGRMSFSWASPTSSYPRPSFSFGSGFGSGSAGAFNWGSAVGAGGGGAGGGGGGGGVGLGGIGGRRASSAQALFAPSSFSSAHHRGEEPQGQGGEAGRMGEGEQGEEDLPDADTSLFEAGFGFSAPAPNSSSASHNPNPTSLLLGGGAGGGVGIGPYGEEVQGGMEQGGQGQRVHAPRPVHAVSSLLGGGFKHEQQEQSSFGEYAADDSPHLSSLGYPSPPHAHSHEGERDGEQQQQASPFAHSSSSLDSSIPQSHPASSTSQDATAEDPQDDDDLLDEDEDDPMSTSTYTPFEFPT